MSIVDISFVMLYYDIIDKLKEKWGNGNWIAIKKTGIFTVGRK